MKQIQGTREGWSGEGEGRRVGQVKLEGVWEAVVGLPMDLVHRKCNHLKGWVLNFTLCFQKVKIGTF